MVYPALLPLVRTPRLPVVDWTDAPTDLNGLVRFVQRWNLVPVRVPSHFTRSLYTVKGLFQITEYASSYKLIIYSYQNLISIYVAFSVAEFVLKPYCSSAKILQLLIHANVTTSVILLLATLLLTLFSTINVWEVSSLTSCQGDSTALRSRPEYHPVCYQPSSLLNTNFSTSSVILVFSVF
jgi:hypothetical protein